MKSYAKPNFLFVFFTLFILVLSVSSAPLSLSSYVFAASDNASDSGKEHGNNGKGHDDGDDGGSDIIFLMSFYIVKGYRVFGDLSFDIRVLSGKEFYLQQISRIQVRLI